MGEERAESSRGAHRPARRAERPPASATRPTWPPAGAEWTARDERSNLVALRLMGWIAVTLGRRAARLLLHPITLYYLCVAATPRRHSARFLGRALGRPATWRECYRHFHGFASTVLDRVFFVRGQMEAFSVTIDGVDLVDAALAEGRGAVLLGAHLGSFEALHAIGHRRAGPGVAMAMYPDNARKIHSVLQALAPEFKLGIIPIGRAGSTLAIRDWLDRGGLVGLLGDRYLGADPRAVGTLALPFLGRPARFTDGPMRLALLLRRRVIFMVGLYHGGNRYEVRFRSLADFSEPVADPAERERRIEAAVRAYVGQLEGLAREAPLNWFNFFDFWGEETPGDG